jgi:hypothetical protein
MMCDRKIYQKDYYRKNKKQSGERNEKIYAYQKQHAYDSITTGEIIDRCTWNLWCERIKRRAKNHPYSVDFTNGIMFDMMIQGCFYCEDVATTIDRVDSTLDHTVDNCVGCCWGCNASKGTADSATFIRKAYYRTREKYYDDDYNIWFISKKKPSICDYKNRATRKEVLFELKKKDFDVLIKGDCKYCHRSPTTWFGIDRVVPSIGYVIDNVAPCCFDCNLDKLESDVESMRARNERIANRVDTGKLTINECEKVILHKGINSSSRRVYAHGIVYANMSSASRALGKCDTYVAKCIANVWHTDDIFEITDEFYDEYKDSENITKDMFIAFEHFYMNM